MKRIAPSLAASSPVAALAGLAGLLLAAAVMAPAHAQTRSEDEIRQQYLADRAACLRERTGEDQQVCIREAGAAAQAARQGKLAHEEEQYRQNALARCAPLPPEQRQACRQRIEGQGTVKGSVESGGLYRELVTREVAPTPVAPGTGAPGASAPAPATTAPATAGAPPAPVATPPAAAAPGRAPSGARPPGTPTFTPIQPVLPGRSPMPAQPVPPGQSATPVPPERSAAPMQPLVPGQGTTPAAPPSAATEGSLQISPPGTPVMQIPTPAERPPNESLPQPR